MALLTFLGVHTFAQHIAEASEFLSEFIEDLCSYDDDCEDDRDDPPLDNEETNHLVISFVQMLTGLDSIQINSERPPLFVIKNIFIWNTTKEPSFDYHSSDDASCLSPITHFLLIDVPPRHLLGKISNWKQIENILL